MALVLISQSKEFDAAGQKFIKERGTRGKREMSGCMNNEAISYRQLVKSWRPWKWQPLYFRRLGFGIALAPWARKQKFQQSFIHFRDLSFLFLQNLLRYKSNNFQKLKTK